MKFQNLTDKEKVLYILSCRSCKLDMNGYDYITTTKSIAHQLKWSQYKVLKNLKELEKDGLSRRVCEGGCADDELRVWCVKGWTITPKVRYLDVYKWANWKESKVMWEIWQIVPSQYYKTNTAQWFEKQRKEDEKWANRT